MIAGVVAYLLLRHLRRPWARRLTVALAILWAVAIGSSRVFLGHHWCGPGRSADQPPTDERPQRWPKGVFW